MNPPVALGIICSSNGVVLPDVVDLLLPALPRRKAKCPSDPSIELERRAFIREELPVLVGDKSWDIRRCGE